MLAPGRPHPLGATVVAGGVQFAVFAGHAERVELCIFDGDRETRHALHASRGTWHGVLPGAGPGTVYGFRVHGPWDPDGGLRHNPAKLLLDPYARRVDGELTWDPAVHGHAKGKGTLRADPRDSAPFVPKAVVMAPAEPMPAGPRVPWRDTVVYEAHVKGMTALHPAVPEHLRGTYGGLAQPAVIEHLQALGVTTLELLPVHVAVSEERLVRQGLVNYWGYGTLGFFAPDPRFATSPATARDEFREMVAALHAAGIEVVLDVVYNHTIEGPADGPTLSLRGLDNRAYYRLDPRAPARTVDWTGCGNTLDLRHAATLRLVLDSLRYWVEVMGVDGFRFDLAPALLRQNEAVAPLGRFVAAIAQDPVLSTVKLIAEPWDLGPEGYALGRFPAPWAEWNDKFRDTARRFWRGDPGLIPDLASRLAGSADVFGSATRDASQARGPLASINYVACHDGFTLADLTAWTVKRNAANGEANRDGTDNNHAHHWGVEGPTDDLRILTLRARARRNLLATAILAQGVPMLGHGDELGRSQGGNNNAYCQDNAVSWVDWAAADAGLIAFVRAALAVRAGNPAFRRTRHFSPHGDAVSWLRPDGGSMEGADWDRGPDGGRAFAMVLCGEEDDARTACLLLNGSAAPVTFVLPRIEGGHWRRVLDTAAGEPRPESAPHEQVLAPWSLQVLEAG